MAYRAESDKDNPYNTAARDQRAAVRASKPKPDRPRFNRYNIYKDVAAEACRIPTGQVYVDGRYEWSDGHSEPKKSFEAVVLAPSPLDPDETRRACLIDPALLFAERARRRRNRAWMAGEGVEG